MNTKLRRTTGKILRVELSEERVWEESLSEDILRKYLGGTSLGMKYLYDEVKPDLDWSDSQNRVYLGSGPLGGIRMAGSGCFSVVTKGALNNGATSSQANGFFGAYLKFSGFDGILIQGAALDWKYLYIHDGMAELRDARHLVDQDTWEVEDSIKKELGYSERHMSVFSIGPAGENLVKFAGIFGDRGHTAPHNGLGAVLGSKKLKAIAVSRSRGKVEVANSTQLDNVVRQLMEIFKTDTSRGDFAYGTSRVLSKNARTGLLPVKNYTTNIFPEADNFLVREVFDIWRFPCWACPSSCRMHMRVTKGPYTGFYGKEPYYEQYAAFGPQIGQTDPGAAVVLANEGDRLGFDCNECGWIIGWVMECYEKGLLNSKDLDGLEMTWGNVEATRVLMKNIAYRKGFGAVLAEGVKHAAEHVGGEAAELAIYTMKASTPRNHDHRGRWAELLDSCVTNVATLETHTGFIKDLTIYGLPPQVDQFSWKQQSDAVAKTKGTLQFIDSLVVCAFPTRCNLPPLAEAVSAAMGWAFSFDEAFKVGRRAVNLAKVYNIRCGLTADMEKPSPRYSSTPIDGPNKGISIKPYLKDMIGNYYKLMGWDEKTGIPLSETLTEFGLEHIIKDLK